MSVHYGFTIEEYGFAHSLSTFLACAAHDAITMEVKDWEERRRDQNESRGMEDSN